MVSVLRVAEDVGLRVHFVTSDPGVENQRMWNDLGVVFSKKSMNDDVSIPHPVDSTRRLEKIPDPIHVFKNLVNG